MTQAEEKTWREQQLIQLAHDSSDGRKTRYVSFGTHRLCLLGFAIMVGGITYERFCYTTLDHLRSSSAH